jgi:hypothetical protein
LPQTVSVGSQTPPSVSFMMSTNIRCGKYSIAPGVSTRHKFGNDTVSPFGPNAWTVLQEYEARSNSVDCAQDFTPESASWAVDSDSFPCCANILAREARMEAIHSSRVFGWIEQPNVSLVHVQTGKPSIGGSLSQDLAAVGVPFDGGNGFMSENKVCK